MLKFKQEIVKLVEELISNNSLKEKIAVFDLDRTLIEGDISDTVFAYFKSIGHRLNLEWDVFLEEIKINPRKLFLEFPTYFQGFEREFVIYATKEVLKYEKINFTENGKLYTSVVPKPKDEFIWLIEYLQSLNFKIGVISASPEDIVKTISKEFYGLDGDKIVGIKSVFEKQNENEKEIYTNQIVMPTTVIEGKADVYHSLFDEKPLITAGDSLNDIYMLNLTHNNGFSIVCNKDINRRELIKSKLHPFIKTVELAY